MVLELRKTGISVIGDAPWGVHFCHFYETKQDLLDTLVPYFKTGLESKELCLWVVSSSDVISVDEAKVELGKAVPDLDRYLSNGNIEILDGHDWYFENGGLNLNSVTNAWDAKVRQALARGYEGLRASADTFWLAQKDWKDFCSYEKQVNKWIGSKAMTVVCTYPMAKSGAADVLDVIQAHQFAIATRQGALEVIHSSEPVKARTEIKRLDKTLQRVTNQKPEAATLRYGIALVSVAAALVITLWMRAAMGPASTPIVAMFLCAVMFSAWYGGAKPGLLAIALSLVAFDYFYVTPLYSLRVDMKEIPRLVIFLLSGIFVGFLSATQGRTAESLRSARDVLSGTVEDLKQANTALLAEITERKQAEEKLRQSETQLAQAQHLAHVGSWNWDFPTDFFHCSEELYRIFGVDPQNFTPTYETFDELVHPQDRALIRELIASSLKTQEPFSSYYRIVRPDGEERVIHSRGQIVSDEQGRPLRAFGMAQDVTERKQAEEALRAAEQKYRDIFENAGEGVFQSTPEGKYIAANPALARMYLFASPEELIKSFDDISRQLYVDPSRRKEFERQLGMKGAVRGFEHEVFRKDGSRIWISVNARAVRHEYGAIQYFEGTVQDITKRKGAEDRIRATSEQLRALSGRLQSAREEEGARIAREIHDELGSVLTGLKWDLEELDKFLSSAGPSDLKPARNKLNALMKLSDTAIDAIRRIASELRPSVLDDLGLMAAIEWQSQQFQARTGIVCYCDCSLEEVELSKEQVTAVFRIFQEALTNVLRHARATTVDIRISKKKHHIVLSVTDNGKGMSEIESSQTPSLGILGMRERAYLIGAEINIKGAEGNGTVVTLRVPTATIKD